MTTLQKLQLKMSEARQQLNELAGLDAPTDEQVTEMDESAKGYAALEVQYRSAVIADSADAVETADESDSEGRELRSIVDRATLGNYMQAALNDGLLDGAESELNAALEIRGGAGTQIPWHMLDDLGEIETRADAPTPAPATVGANQSGILGRVFARTAAAWLGVAMPQVPVGEAVYTTLTTGQAAAPQAKDGKVEAAAGVFTPQSVGPTRLTARYLFRMEDAAVLRGMEESLRADLRGALGEELDKQIIAGDGSAPNFDGFHGALTAAATVSAVATASDYINALSGAVDGRYALSIDDVRMLVGAETYAHMMTLFFASTSVNVSDYLAQAGARIRVSAHVPAAASSKQDAILSTNPAQGAVAPMWPSVSVIRDIYTGAAAGQISLTIVALGNFVIRQSGGYKLTKFQTA